MRNLPESFFIFSVILCARIFFPPLLNLKWREPGIPMKRIMLLFHGVISGGVNFTAVALYYIIESSQGKQLHTDLKMDRAEKESETVTPWERDKLCYHICFHIRLSSAHVSGTAVRLAQTAHVSWPGACCARDLWPQPANHTHPVHCTFTTGHHFQTETTQADHHG